MIEYYNNIISGKDIKENLLSLKNELKASDKEGTLKDTLLGCCFEKADLFLKLLQNEDPKIRQNTAVCLSYLDLPGSAKAIYGAYLTDDTLYNKAPYLKALSRLPHSEYDEELLKIHDRLTSAGCSEDEAKHVAEEVRELKIMLNLSSVHHFTGFDLINEAVLTTNRNHKGLTAEKLKAFGIPHKEYPAGLMVKTKHIREVSMLRTYEELLFIPDGAGTCKKDPAAAAEQLINGKLTEYIFSRHDNSGEAFRFRVELRTPDAAAKASFEKKIAQKLEVLSGWKLANSVSDYEAELRFIDSPDAFYRVLIKFSTFPDKRFAYRKEALSVGMKPYIAATAVKLAEEYLHDNAVVLDPFCGTGTLLVERDRLKPVRKLYGIDIFGEAVKKAAVNIKLAGISGKTELINKDFFDFRHSHRFTEIITDLPYGTAFRTLTDVEELYKRFFRSVPCLLEKDNTLVLYTRNREFVKKYSSLFHFDLLKEYEISAKENTWLYILTYDQD